MFFFLSDSRASKDTNLQFSYHSNAQIVRFCLFNIVVFLCFLHVGQMPLSFFGEICGRIGNEMPGSVGQKKGTHIPMAFLISTVAVFVSGSFSTVEQSDSKFSIDSWR